MLTQLIQGLTLLGEEWVLWILVALSFISFAIMIERLLFFWGHRLKGIGELAKHLEQGDAAAARAMIENHSGMEANAVRDALDASGRGSESVDEVLSATLTRERMRYERGLSVLGTLGNNAPFIGLFGTVLGIIRAFHDLSSLTPGSKGDTASTVMSGISGALAATAVGLAVAIPAVVAFNGFQRWLKQINANAIGLGHAWQSHLKAEGRDRKVA